MLQLPAPEVDQRPASHEAHEVAPASLFLPASQALQSSSESWKLARLPLSLRNFPLGQELQLLAPLLGLYSPSPQIEHVIAPSTEYVPASQGLQTLPSKYSPAGHDEIDEFRLKYVV